MAIVGETAIEQRPVEDFPAPPRPARAAARTVHRLLNHEQPRDGEPQGSMPNYVIRGVTFNVKMTSARLLLQTGDGPIRPRNEEVSGTFVPLVRQASNPTSSITARV